MAVAQPKLYTVDEFEAFIAHPENAEHYFELINGEIVEKVPTEKHGYISVNVTTPIRIHTRQTGRGRVVSEVRHRLPDDDHNARQPDISYYMDATRPMVEQGAVLRLPDLAIEIKSPTDSYRKLREKADYYLANGVKLVWLIYPEKRLVEVQPLDELFGEDDILDGGEVIPGFTLLLREIFAE